MAPDDALLARMASGDDEALAEFTGRHRGAVYSVAATDDGIAQVRRTTSRRSLSCAGAKAGRYDPNRGTWRAILTEWRRNFVLRAGTKVSSPLDEDVRPCSRMSSGLGRRKRSQRFAAQNRACRHTIARRLCSATCMRWTMRTSRPGARLRQVGTVRCGGCIAPGDAARKAGRGERVTDMDGDRLDRIGDEGAGRACRFAQTHKQDAAAAPSAGVGIRGAGRFLKEPKAEMAAVAGAVAQRSWSPRPCGTGRTFRSGPPRLLRGR